jgi:hypothetical protein
MDYGHKDEIVSWGLWENRVSSIDLDCINQKKQMFTSLKSTAAPGDHFEVSVNVPVTISISNFNKVQTSSM